MQEPIATSSEDEEPQRPDYVTACAFAKGLTRVALILLLPLAFVSFSPAISFGPYLAILLVVVFLSDMAWDLLARHILQRQGQTVVSPANLLGRNLGFWGVIVVGATLGTLITRDDGWRPLAIVAIQLALFWGIPRLLAAREP